MFSFRVINVIGLNHNAVRNAALNASTLGGDDTWKGGQQVIVGTNPSRLSHVSTGVLSIATLSVHQQKGKSKYQANVEGSKEYCSN